MAHTRYLNPDWRLLLRPATIMSVTLTDAILWLLIADTVVAGPIQMFPFMFDILEDRLVLVARDKVAGAPSVG